jgi:hypothetical protein
MQIGLLWYDGDPRQALEDKIGRAARRYREKYGRWPNTCYVHPQAVAQHAGEDPPVVCRLQNPGATIRVLSAPNILLHHFWLGESTEPDPARSEKTAN